MNSNEAEGQRKSFTPRPKICCLICFNGLVYVHYNNTLMKVILAGVMTYRNNNVLKIYEYISIKYKEDASIGHIWPCSIGSSPPPHWQVECTGKEETLPSLRSGPSHSILYVCQHSEVVLQCKLAGRNNSFYR